VSQASLRNWAGQRDVAEGKIEGLSSVDATTCAGCDRLEARPAAVPPSRRAAWRKTLGH
jgi:hypothetical protein